MYKVLVVDGDIATLTMVEEFLDREGYQVSTAISAREAQSFIERDRPELLVINTRLNGMDGLALCRKLRANPSTVNTPIIFITGPDAPHTVSEVLEAGGDDYLRKPFALRELSARIRAHLRRIMAASADEMPMLTIMPHTLSVLVDDRSVSLTQVEFELLMHLCGNPNQLYTTHDLLMDVWQYPAGTGDAALVRNHIRNLRRKVEEDPERPAIIQSRHGRGYAVKARVQIQNHAVGGAR